MRAAVADLRRAAAAAGRTVRVWAVGGAVRDPLLARAAGLGADPGADWDLATDAGPELLLAAFADAAWADARLGAVRLAVEEGDITITSCARSTATATAATPTG